MVSPTSPFANRPLKKLALFDVDGTLSLARLSASSKMIDTLRALKKVMVIGCVGGSDMKKIVEQLNVHGFDALAELDYFFAENGLTAYKMGQQLQSQSFIKYVGEDRYKKMVNFILRYLADVECPVKRGTFIEFRNGMVNVSPVGRNATTEERLEFQAYDKIHNIRSTFVSVLQKEFSDYGLTFAIGGQISFDIFPNGWDKTYSLRHVEDEAFEEVHFFGDKTDKGGNDHELYEDSRTIGHSVKNPEHTIQLLNELFLNA